MAFDPDAYLADKKASAPKGGGFDPDAYLAEKRGAEEKRAKLKALNERIPEKLRQIEEESPSLLHEVGAGLKGQAKQVGQAAKEAGRGVLGALDYVGGKLGVSSGALADQTVANAPWRRQLERGVSDAVTGGLATKAADAIIKAGGSKDTFASTADADAAAGGEGARALGTVGGSFLPSPANLMAGKTASLVRQAIPKPGMVAGALRGAATGAAVAPVYAGTNAALAGENPLRAAGDAFMNPAGVAVGAALGAAGGKAQGTAAKIRDPKTMTGRTIADVEAAGGRIKPLGRPVEGGLFDSPEVAGLQEGRAGINEAAGNARDTILEANQKKLAAARAEYGESVDKILAEHGGRRHLVDNTHARLNELEAENTVNGEVLDEHLDRAIKKVRRMTEAEAGNVVVPAVKVEDLIKIKKGVNRLADWKAPVSPENRPYREIARSLDKDAAAIDPRIGEMNKAYKAALEPIEETHGILLGGRRKTDVKPTDAQLKGAALKLGRVGDDTQAATTDDVARLRALSPENDRAVRTVAAKKALERLRYGANETSTSIEKGMANAAERGAAGKVGAVVGEAAGGLPGAAVGYAAGKAAHALATPAGRVRLVLPAAEAAARAEQRRTPNVLVQMALEKKRREQELARRLGGGAP